MGHLPGDRPGKMGVDLRAEPAQLHEKAFQVLGRSGQVGDAGQPSSVAREEVDRRGESLKPVDVSQAAEMEVAEHVRVDDAFGEHLREGIFAFYALRQEPVGRFGILPAHAFVSPGVQMMRSAS